MNPYEKFGDLFAVIILAMLLAAMWTIFVVLIEHWTRARK